MDLFSNLVSHVKTPLGKGDLEMKFEQGSVVTKAKLLSGNLRGREWLSQRGKG